MDARRNSFRNAQRRQFIRRSMVPMGTGFLVIIAVLFSILFILSAMLAFVNPNAVAHFRDNLNKVSAQQSGIALLGENVDVDVDEPSVTIRWSVLGCGAGFILPGSPKLHGSKACGAPAIPLEVFIEESDTPVFTYDPEDIAVRRNSGEYVITQAQVQFDSNLILDVHDTLLYPFDTYLVSMSLRASSSNSSVKDMPVPIIGVPVIQHMPSFSMTSSDTDIMITLDDDKVPGRHMEIQIKRPSHARVYSMLIFGINWGLCHFSCGIAVLSVWKGTQIGSKGMLRQVAAALVVLFIVPQLRSAMPDAPGFDGVLIDTIGFFPQMTLAGLSVIILLLIFVKSDMDDASERIPNNSKHQNNLRERLGTSIGATEGVKVASISGWTRSIDRIQGHSRNQSLRDYVLEQAMRVLDAGSQILKGANDKGQGIFSADTGASGAASGSGTRLHVGRSHLHSRSYCERRMA